MSTHKMWYNITSQTMQCLGFTTECSIASGKISLNLLLERISSLHERISSLQKKNGMLRFLGKIIDWPNIFVLFAWKLIINLTRSWNKTQFSFATIEMVKKFSLITFLIYFIAWNWVQLLLLFHKDQKCNIYIKTLSNEYLHLMKMNHLAAFHSSYLGLWTIFYSAKLIGNKVL